MSSDDFNENVDGTPTNEGDDQSSEDESTSQAPVEESGGGGEEPEEKKKKKRGFLILILSIALVCGGITIGIATLLPLLTNPSPLLDMEGNVVIPDDPSATESAFMEAAQMVVDDGGLGFRIPAVKLNVPLGSINDVRGSMNPANYTSAFWIRNRGVSTADAEKGTVYVVAHAAINGLAPGNFVQKEGKLLLQPGDIIQVNDRDYKFVKSESVAQSKISELTYIWEENTPNRLVFITCLQRVSQPTNLIIIGELVT